MREKSLFSSISLSYHHPYHCRSFVMFRCQSSLHQPACRQTGHPSGLRPLVKHISIDPFRLIADQKIFGSLPCPYGLLQISWFLTSPFVAHSTGSKDVDNFINIGWSGFPIKPRGSANPISGSPPQPALYTKHFSGIKGTPSLII